MVTGTHLYLALTNIFGIIPLVTTTDFYDKCLVSSVVVASVAMHLSETKHYLKPHPYLASKADWFLNMDRGAALVSMLLLFPRWWKYGTWAQAMFFATGLTASGLGELSTHVPTYCALHTWWHFVSYMTLYMIM